MDPVVRNNFLLGDPFHGPAEGKRKNGHVEDS
jgi:hypothetical protein